MADVFMQCDARNVLKNKHILFMGDSNTRALYKDLVWLLNFNTLIPQKSLKTKLEPSYLGDKLTTERGILNHGRDFQESRIYFDKSNGTTLEFMFLTRCFSYRLENLFKEFKTKARLVPDVILINSCLWDLTRWGPNGVPEYKDNMVKLMRMMKQSLPTQCLVIWSTALPTGPHVRGGLLIKQIKFLEHMLRFEVMEANTFARELVVSHGFDILDNHYHTRMQMHRRAKDGVHYMPVPVRFMTNLLLTHIALTWDLQLPNNIQSLLLDKAIAMQMEPPEKLEVKIPNSGIFSKLNLVSPVVPRNRSLTVTFNPQQRGTRQCNIFDQELSEISPSAEEARSSRIRSVVQLPEKNQEPHAATGPYRRKRNKNKRKTNRPYHEPYYNPDSNNTTSYYNPIENHCPEGRYYGGRYRNQQY